MSCGAPSPAIDHSKRRTSDMNEPPRENMILRTVYLDREVDELLRRQAASRDISKGERIRQLIARGLEAEAQTSGPSSRER